MAVISASPGRPVSLLSAVTTGTGVAVAVPMSEGNCRITLTGVGTVTGGTIVLEEAESPTYNGTWSQLYSLTFSVTALTNLIQTIHIMGKLGFVRARISANVTGGGTVSADLITG
jgi:hypothetical protein